MVELKPATSTARFSQAIYGEGGQMGAVDFRDGERPSLLEQPARGRFSLIEQYLADLDTEIPEDMTVAGMLTLMAEQTVRILDDQEGVLVDTTPLQFSFTISSPANPGIVAFQAVRGKTVYQGELYTPLFQTGHFAGFPMLAAKYDSVGLNASARTSVSIRDFVTADTTPILSELGQHTVGALLQTA